MAHSLHEALRDVANEMEAVLPSTSQLTEHEPVAYNTADYVRMVGVLGRAMTELGRVYQVSDVRALNMVHAGGELRKLTPIIGESR